MSIGLDLCNGPPCPRCGCRDTELLEPPPARRQRGGWWTGVPDPGWLAQVAAKTPVPTDLTPIERFVCRHCRLGFHARRVPDPPPVTDQAGDQGSTTEDAEGTDLSASSPLRVSPSVPSASSVVDPAALPPVIFPPVVIPSGPDPAVCPHCGGAARVTSTQGRVQYRRCRQCGAKLKTQRP
jgi:hypothetical protein